jgi:hypothetical protein
MATYTVHLVRPMLEGATVTVEARDSWAARNEALVLAARPEVIWTAGEQGPGHVQVDRVDEA